MYNIDDMMRFALYGNLKLINVSIDDQGLYTFQLCKEEANLNVSDNVQELYDEERFECEDDMDELFSGEFDGLFD